MDIVVTVKQVIDPNLPSSHISIDEKTKKIVSPYGLPPVMNGYDANALEAALKLREAHGGRVTVLCLGDNSCRNTLKRAHAMGADAVFLLDDPAWAELDSSGLGQVIAAAVRKVGACDLVLCGRQASDTDGGQVLFWLAQALGMPTITPVSAIEASEEQALIVHRLMDEGYQRVQVNLPALLGISSEINQPRNPSMKGTMLANKSLAPSWKAQDLGLGELSRKVELKQLEIQTRTSRAKLLEGITDEAKGVALADELHRMGLI
jgi:electron transfer flavoprotein beta subunit